MSQDSTKRARILEAAMSCFTETGLQGTTTAALARSAVMSPGTLFLYFPSKDAVIEGACLAATGSLTEFVRFAP